MAGQLSKHFRVSSRTSNVYGSRFASQHMPSQYFPEEEMPKDVAYRMIKDDLILDGHPMLKYATSYTISND